MVNSGDGYVCTITAGSQSAESHLEETFGLVPRVLEGDDDLMFNCPSFR